MKKKTIERMLRKTAIATMAMMLAVSSPMAVVTAFAAEEEECESESTEEKTKEASEKASEAKKEAGDDKSDASSDDAKGHAEAAKEASESEEKTVEHVKKAYEEAEKAMTKADSATEKAKDAANEATEAAAEIYHEIEDNVREVEAIVTDSETKSEEYKDLVTADQAEIKEKTENISYNSKTDTLTIKVEKTDTEGHAIKDENDNLVYEVIEVKDAKADNAKDKAVGEAKNAAEDATKKLDEICKLESAEWDEKAESLYNEIKADVAKAEAEVANVTAIKNDVKSQLDMAVTEYNEYATAYGLDTIKVTFDATKNKYEIVSTATEEKSSMEVKADLINGNFETAAKNLNESVEAFNDATKALDDALVAAQNAEAAAQVAKEAIETADEVAKELDTTVDSSKKKSALEICTKVEDKEASSTIAKQKEAVDQYDKLINGYDEEKENGEQVHVDGIVEKLSTLTTTENKNVLIDFKESQNKIETSLKSFKAKLQDSILKVLNIAVNNEKVAKEKLAISEKVLSWADSLKKFDAADKKPVFEAFAQLDGKQVATFNVANFDIKKTGITSNDQKKFTSQGQTTATYGLYREYVAAINTATEKKAALTNRVRFESYEKLSNVSKTNDELYHSGATEDAGTLSRTYWVVENGKLTGKCYKADEVNKVIYTNDIEQGEHTFFVGYSLKVEQNGNVDTNSFHLDGYYMTIEVKPVPEKEQEEKTEETSEITTEETSEETPEVTPEKKPEETSEGENKTMVESEGKSENKTVKDTKSSKSSSKSEYSSTPTTATVSIDTEDVPLALLNTDNLTFVDDEATPLAHWIDDEEVPFSSMPQTGDDSMPAVPFAAAGGFFVGLAMLIETYKKRIRKN